MWGEELIQPDHAFIIAGKQDFIMDSVAVLKKDRDSYTVVGSDRPSFSVAADEKIDERIAEEIFGRQRLDYVEELEINPGSYWRRVARPLPEREKWTLGYYPGIYDHPFSIRRSTNEVRALVRDLDELFVTLDPNEKNLSAFGNRIRNLLIIAATECETQWRAILSENQYGRQDRLNTRDYVRLLRLMKLDEYEVSLTRFPWLGTFSPFHGWKADKPTQTLEWYDCYNAVKHDREAAIERGNLRACLLSVCASYLTLVAQFGRAVPDNALSEHFTISSFPCWKPAEVYCPSSMVRGPDDYVAVPCPMLANA